MDASALRAAIWATFAADSLALGAHWMYDQQKIVSRLGTVDTLIAPLPSSPHSGKQAGDFTHYGDQTLILLRSLAACGRFDVKDFARRWIKPPGRRWPIWSRAGIWIRPAHKATTWLERPALHPCCMFWGMILILWSRRPGSRPE